jgi:hypothetical protein
MSKALPINPNAVPVSNRSPYQRIDPRYPGRRTVITDAELAASESGDPDPAAYQRVYLGPEGMR